MFVTVLHQLMRGGSDLAADRWREEYRISGSEDLDLHHLYRAMAWLGEALPAEQQEDATRIAPRCTKDLIEEQLFAYRRDLFSRTCSHKPGPSGPAQIGPTPGWKPMTGWAERFAPTRHIFLEERLPWLHLSEAL